MKKVWDFLKANMLIVKWTIGYFFVLWFILKFIFNFDMFSFNYWWKFFHATMHGFGGLVFCALVYAALPIYIATVLIIYRKQEPIITIPFFEKASDFISSLFSQKKEIVETKEEPEQETIKEQPSNEYPNDLPSELRVPFMRAKNHLSLTGAVSVYNKQKAPTQPSTPEQIMKESGNNIPLPTDFDISDSLESPENDFVPTFTDINFDEPVVEKKLENNTTKYFESKKIEFETYKNFVATEKYLIYEHNDGDFWIMDEDAWFAAGKQTENPTRELIDIAKQNGLIPVLYLQSQNIMDIESTIDNFETAGIRVVKSLDELD